VVFGVGGLGALGLKPFYIVLSGVGKRVKAEGEGGLQELLGQTGGKNWLSPNGGARHWGGRLGNPIDDRGEKKEKKNT